MYISFGEIVLFLFLLCFVVITVFVSITLYKVILTLKSVNEIIEENREPVNVSVKSVSGILDKVDGVSGKVFSKVEEDEEEINSNIPKYTSYIIGIVSFIVSILNIFKQKKDTD